MAKRSVKRVSAFLVVALVAATVSVVLPATPASSSQVFFFDDNAFGANEGIYISGDIEYACDFIYPSADVYVVPTGQTTGALQDVSGKPNVIIAPTLGAAFFDELIGITQPTGVIGEGTYAIVIDECQDGQYTPGLDFVLDPAFTVDLPAVMPPIDQHLANLKADAADQADQWHDAAIATGGLLLATMLYELISEWLGSPAEIAVNFYLTWVCSGMEAAGIGQIDGSPVTPWCPTVSVQAKLQLYLAVVKQMVDQARHYEGIHADPPDPNFSQPATLAAAPTFEIVTDDPLEPALVALGEEAAQGAALSQALLASLEKYQGAAQQLNGPKGLMHARNVQHYADMLAANIVETNTAIDDLQADVGGDGRDFSTLATDGAALQAALGGGLPGDHEQALKNLGLTDTDIEFVSDEFEKADFSQFKSDADVNAVLQGLEDQNDQTAASLADLSAGVQAIITTLEDQDFDVLPVADAGGPYTGPEGTPIAFDASGSSDPQGQTLTYAWDLDADGQFDDGVGATPSFTYPSARSSLVGVRATDPNGNVGIDYAELTVTEVNQPPAFTTVTPPAGGLQPLGPGEQQAFSVTTSDPNGDVVTVRWYVNGALAGTGNSFTFTASASNLGPNSVKAVATDTSPFGGSTDPTWTVWSVAADGDGDGWDANVDCDDTDPAVNPGATEVVGDKIDNDCSLATADRPGNLAPTAGNVNTGTPEDAPVDITLAGSDPNGDAINYDVLTQPAKGTLSGTAPDLTYTPDDDATGSDSFTYKVDDGDLESAPATVTITITPVNDTPFVPSLSAETPEDTAVDIILSGEDPDGDPLTFDKVDDPTNGTVVVAGGTATYTPNPDFFGSDSFTYKANDGDTDSNTATVTVTVTSVNDPPVAGPVAVTTPEDNPVQIALLGSDADGDGLTFAVASEPANGTLGPVAGNKVAYTPDPNFNGVDSFTYTVSDGTATSSPATVSITVESIDDLPIAKDVEATGTEDTPLQILLKAEDEDTNNLDFTIVSPPQNGTHTISGLTVTYTPDPEYVGPDSFTYRVSDATSDSNVATVSILIEAANDPPVAIDDSAATFGGSPVTFNVLANDGDVDGGPLVLESVGAPTAGVASKFEGKIRFTPPAGQAGTANIPYTVSDGLGGTDSAILTVLYTDDFVRSRTWTEQNRFGEGTAVNVVPDGPNRLRLDDKARATNRLWVALSSIGTIVKIDTETNEVLGEYRTAPEGQPLNPSRTTVDLNGNVWATNRDGNSVVSVGLVENDQCEDRNGNGVIDTSTGYEDVRAWPNGDGLDTNGGVENAADECIIHYVKVRTSGTRHVAVNRDNDVWVSGTGGSNFDLISDDGVDDDGDGDTADIIRQENSVGYGGYGGLIDPNGVIWSARSLLRWDTSKPLTGPNSWPAIGTTNWTGYPNQEGVDSYGLCIDPNDGSVWETSLTSNRLRKYNPDGTEVDVYFDHGHYNAQGCAVDQNGHVWVANSLYSDTVGHLLPDGRYVGIVDVGKTTGSGPTGVAVDGKGFVWSTNHNDGTVSKIDPNAGPTNNTLGVAIGEVVATIDLKRSAPDNRVPNLYNYSDMTGSTLSGAPEEGTWSTVLDSTKDMATWAGVTWTAMTPGDAGLRVLVATSNDNITFGPPVEVDPNTPLVVDPGRYLRLSANLTRATATQGQAVGNTPILQDVTAWTGAQPPQVADVQDTTPENTPKELTLVGTDEQGDQLTFTVLSPPVDGNGNPAGRLSPVVGDKVTYTPVSFFTGPATFTFQATDGRGLSNIGTALIDVTPVNDPPLAFNTRETTPVGTPVNVELPIADPEQEPVTPVIVGEPEHGSLGALSNGTVVYTPDDGFTGVDQFTFKAVEDEGEGEATDFRAAEHALESRVATATISVGGQPPPPPPPTGGGGTVVGTNRPPVAVNGQAVTQAGTPVQLTLQATDPDGNPLTWSLVAGPAAGQGTLSAITGNVVTFTPAPGFAGNASFTWKANDGALDSNIATTTVLVESVLQGVTQAPDYRMAGADGGVFAFGSQDFLGTAGVKLKVGGDATAAAILAPSLKVLNAPIVDIAHAPNDRGYWLAGADGGVFAIGTPFYGSAGSLDLDRPVTAIAATPSGKGYWLAAEDGGVFAYGDAKWFGALPPLRLNAPIVDIEATPTGRGYWMVGADGGVFAFGDARHLGGITPNRPAGPVVGMASTPDGRGYWLVTNMGAVSAFGTAKGYGSPKALNQPVVGIAASRSGLGYWLAAADGGLFAFGDAPFRGSIANGTSSKPGPGCCSRLNGPIVGIAS